MSREMMTGKEITPHSAMSISDLLLPLASGSYRAGMSRHRPTTVSF
jgi:hypothetical protein